MELLSKHNYGAFIQELRRPSSAMKLFLFLVMLLLGVVLFHFQGNSTDVKAFGHSVFYWIAQKWNDPDGTMSHGWIIPLVSAYFMWTKRKELAAAEKNVYYPALCLVGLALLCHWTGIRIQQSRFAILSIIGLLWSIPFFLYGKHVAKLILFPCAYLLFCLPLNFLSTITFPLRLFASTLSAFLLNGLGIATTRVGTMLHGSGADAFHLDVADPCSGLKSIIAITALTTAYAQLTQSGLLKKLTMVTASIPIAIIANIARITIIAISHILINTDMANTLTHDYSGYLVFITAFLLVMGLDRIMNSDFLLRKKASS